MYAIIKTGGKQYQVEEGKVISVEKLIAEQGDEVTFDDVLLVSGEDVKIGKPNVEGAKVVGVVLEQGKEAKIRIFKYKAKSNYRRRQVIVSHLQKFRLRKSRANWLQQGCIWTQMGSITSLMYQAMPMDIQTIVNTILSAQLSHL